MAQVKIKVRPQQTVTFPGICVHCAQPAPETMLIRKRISRVTRLIRVPVCPACAAQLRRKSLEEEQLGRLQWLVSGAALLITFAAGLIALPPGMVWWARGSIALLAAVVITAVILIIFRQKIQEVYLPEKQAVLNAARIENFSWRATTFAFENEEFERRFVTINEPLLMEI
jgi:hypothetical protein